MRLRKHFDTDLLKKINKKSYKKQEKCKPSSINIHFNLFEVINLNHLLSKNLTVYCFFLASLLFPINFLLNIEPKTELQLYSTQNYLVEKKKKKKNDWSEQKLRNVTENKFVLPVNDLE